MSGVISGSYSSGFTLSINPTTITGTIITSGAYAIANLTNQGFACINDGVLQGTAYGVELRDGASLTNNASGNIYGVSTGVGIYVSAGASYPAAQLYNAGTIAGGSIVTQNQAAGVYIRSSAALGATFVNGTAGVVFAAEGVRALNAAVVNDGTLLSDLPTADGTAYGLTGIGGALTNAVSGLIENGANLDSDQALNQGTITDGVGLLGLAVASNALGGLITNYALQRSAVQMDPGFDGTVLNNATLINDGSIGGLNGVYDGAGIVINNGMINGAGTLASHAGGYSYLHGDGITIYATGPFVSVTQAVTNDAGGTIMGARFGAFLSNGFGQVGAAEETFSNFGLLEGSVGVELFGGDLIDTGTIASTDSAGADLAVQFGLLAAPGAYIASTLVLGTSAVVTGTIGGFDTAATILLAGFTETADSFANGDLVLQGGPAARTLAFAGTFSTSSFLITSLTTGTEITLQPAVCYLRGTRILTPAGEVPVEALAIGDAVITRFGGYRPIKWIGRQSFARRFIAGNRQQCPVRIAAGALGGGLPLRDLFISPGHSMLIGDVLVLAAALVNGITITQPEAPAEVHYYQLEFETHDCVLAEGAWSESYADTPDWRAKFHNAAEFYALYPDHVPPAEQSLAAPRPLAGPALAAALGPIVARAAAGLPAGELRGCIDELSPTGTLRGWAWDAAHPHLPVSLDILAQGRRIGQVLACDERADLAAAGFGAGRCGFTFTTSLGLPPAGTLLRRTMDGARLGAAAIRAA